MNRLHLAGIVLLLGLGLSGCGGGSGGGTGVTPPLRTVSVSVDPSAAQAVVAIASPAGASQNTREVPSPELTPTGQTLFVAVDGAGKLLLAAVADVTTTTVSLSVESTAAALARLAIGAASSPETARLLDASVLASPRFAQLRDAIKQAIQSQRPPLESSDVSAVLADVVDDAQASASRSGLTGPTSRKRTLVTVAEPVPPSFMPHVLISSSAGSYYDGFVVSSANRSQISLRNGTPIPWALTIESDDGSAPTQGLVMAPGELLRLAPGTASAGFNISLFQSLSSHRQIGALLAKNLSQVIMSFANPRGCTESLLVGALNQFFSGATVGTWQDLYVAIRDSTVVVSQCAQDPGMTQVAQAVIDGILKSRSPTGKIYAAASLVALIRVAEVHWDSSTSAGFCLDSSGQHVACPRSIAFDRDSITLTPSAQFNPSIQIIDRESNSSPPIAGRLSFSSSNPLVARVGSQSGAITGVAIGTEPVVIRATDTWTGVSGTMTVRVATPTVTPRVSQVVIQTRDTVKLTITDPSGGDIILPSGTVVWSIVSGDPRKLRLLSSDVVDGRAFSWWQVSEGVQPDLLSIEARVNAANSSTTQLVIGTAAVSLIDAAVVAEVWRVATGTNCGLTTGQQGGLPAGSTTCGGMNTGSALIPTNSSSVNSSGVTSSFDRSQRKTVNVFESGDYVNTGLNDTLRPDDVLVCRMVSTGLWVPRQKDWRATWKVTAQSKPVSTITCNGEDDWLFFGRVGIDSVGNLVGSFTRQLDSRTVCTEDPPWSRYTQTSTRTNRKTGTIAYLMSDGRGSASDREVSRNEFDQASITTVFPTYSRWDETTIVGSGSWPADTASPPLLTGLNMKLDRRIFSGGTLPEACLVQTQ